MTMTETPILDRITTERSEQAARATIIANAKLHLTTSLEALQKLSPADLIDTLDQVAKLIQTAPFPELVYEDVTDDGETYRAARCPHCGLIADDITALDWGTRKTDSYQVEVDEERDTTNAWISYDERIEAEGLAYLHTDCGKPINNNTIEEDN